MNLPPGLVLVDIARQAVQTSQQKIRHQIFLNPDLAFAPAKLTSGKSLIAADSIAQNAARDVIEATCKDFKIPIQVYGEESDVPSDLDLSEKETVVALVDMLDGTDLMIRGLGNWCSAILFYAPPALCKNLSDKTTHSSGMILASMVGIPDGTLYYAFYNTNEALRYLPEEYDPTIHDQVKKPGLGNIQVIYSARRVTSVSVRKIGASKNGKAKNRSDTESKECKVSLQDASICFYGQKPSRLIQMADSYRFSDLIAKSRCLKTLTKSAARLYTLAGNPMMMRMLDGHQRIDAVFDILGQFPHDMAPGAYIATKAGAALSDLDGNAIDLAKSLQTPFKKDCKVKYILSTNESLHSELIKALKKS